MKMLSRKHAFFVGTATALLMTVVVMHTSADGGGNFSAFGFTDIDISYLCKLPGFRNAPACNASVESITSSNTLFHSADVQTTDATPPVESTVDSDGDGLTDRQETEIGTDQKRSDTDGDGTPDGTEALVGRNPISLTPEVGVARVTTEGTDSVLTTNEEGETKMFIKDFGDLTDTERETDIITASYVPNRLIIKMEPVSSPLDGMVTPSDEIDIPLINVEESLAEDLGAIVEQVQTIEPAFSEPATPPASAVRSVKDAATRAAVAFEGVGLDDIYAVNVIPKEGQDMQDVAVQVEQLDGVVWAQPDYLLRATMTPNDLFFAKSGSFGQSYDDLWGLKAINAPTAWDVSQGQGVVVAVVDTGVDITHPDLAANIWTNPREIPGNGKDDEGNGFIDDVNGWDFVKKSPIVPGSDGHGHGTHVAGTIAAVGNNSIGVIGVAPKAKIMPIRGLDAQGFGSLSDLAAGIRYAADNGADVINMSFGGTVPGGGNLPGDILGAALEYSRKLGVVNVAAAGNDGTDAINTSPANLTDRANQKLSIVVGADIPGVVQVSPNLGRAYFSNFGRTVDVSAPGGGNSTLAANILSTMSVGTLANLRPQFNVLQSLYWRLAGTSMATPHVAGAAALILAAHPEFRQNLPQRLDLVRSLLRATSTDLNTDQYLGTGRIDTQKPMMVQGLPPRASFENLDRTVVGGTISLKGTAAGEPFASYSIEMKMNEQVLWQTLITSTTPVENGVLLTNWDTSDLPSGVYNVRLTVKNANGLRNRDLARVTIRSFRLSRPFNNDVVRLGDTLPVSGTVQGTFDSYSIRYGEGWAPTQWFTNGVTLQGNGTQPVVDGPLGKWDTSVLTRGGYYTMELAVKRAGRPDVSMRARLLYLDPMIKKGWPVKIDQAMGYGSTFSVLVDDLDGDGKKEIIQFGPSNPFSIPMPEYVLQEPKLRVFDPDGRLKLEKTIQGETDLRFSGTLPPAIADLNGDGIKEIIVDAPECFGATTETQCPVYAFKPDGSLLPGWLVRVRGDLLGMWPQKVTADVDADGRDDVVFLSIGPAWGMRDVGKQSLSVLRGNGTMHTIAYFDHCLHGNQKFPTFAVGQLDQDRELEIVVPSGKACNGIAAYNLDGSLVSGWPRILPGISFGSIVTGDLDRDGKDEVLRYSGNVLFSDTPAPAAQLGGYLNVFRSDGTAFPGWPKKVNTTDWIFGHQSPALGDMDGDGFLEIALPPALGSTGDCAFHLYRSDGTEMPGWPARVGTLKPCDDFFGFFPQSVSIGDVDGDGMADVVFAGAGTNYYAVRDGTTERSGGITAWNSTGERIDLNGPLPGGALMIESPGSTAAAVKTREPPIITDIDGDGKVEIVVATQDDGDKVPGAVPNGGSKGSESIFVWDLPATYHPQTMFWPGLQHDSGLTGRAPLPPLPSPSVCGDGIKARIEACDDGNLKNDDGCSSTCTVQPNWSCIGSPSVCILQKSPVCGDGARTGTEACDDGNLIPNDGCNATCTTIDQGYTCTIATPNVCSTTCGDDFKAGTEACDDGNMRAGDGCSETCTVEAGYTCTTATPNVCSMLTCYDPDGQDITRATTVILPSGAMWPDRCEPGVESRITEMECQNGSVLISNMVCPVGTKCSLGACVSGGPPASGEELYCSDSDGGFNISVPGATASIQGSKKDTCVQSGAAMELLESYCLREGRFAMQLQLKCPAGTLCQNGVNGGACVSSFSPLPPPSPPPPPPPPSPVCGDGIKAPTEGCDDGNFINGDGCNTSCTVEAGYTCSTATPNVCTRNQVCGDGIKAPTEGCDDGNTRAGDGCSATCTVEKVSACTDPDGGQDITRATTVITLVGELWPDKCSNDSSIIEMYCASASVLGTVGVACPVGTKCSQGACVSGGPPASGEELYCSDSDGGFNISVPGIAKNSYLSIPQMDTCKSITTGIVLMESYCPRNTSSPRFLEVVCPAGTLCQNSVNGGACVPTGSVPTPTPIPVHPAPPPPSSSSSSSSLTSSSSSLAPVPTPPPSSCTDPDGQDITRATTVILSSGAMWPDRCEPGIESRVTEMECQNGSVLISNMVCPVGTKCSLGACVSGGPPASGEELYCSDSDGGFNISVPGATASIQGSKKDTCVQSGAAMELLESYCLREGRFAMQLQLKCPAGTLCQNGVNGGACVSSFSPLPPPSPAPPSPPPPPSPPTPPASVCGDGARTGTEACDDGNFINGDGCSTSCTVEIGYACTTATPNVCRRNQVCGNGSVEAPEGCDDGNLTNGDGCSFTCTVESGYTCNTTTPNACRKNQVCGNGSVEAPEGCDDSNFINGDGCSTSCVVEAGYTCTTATPSVCTRNQVCGDGIKAPTEGCDDGNFINGDGCNTSCTVEAGYTCSTATPNVCTRNQVCGDGIKAPTEGCDDGNTRAGDGCSATCTVEKVSACTDQDGQNITRATTVVSPDGKLWPDKCNNDSSIMEMYCQSASAPGALAVPCPVGMQCSDGACIAGGPLPSGSELDCSDPDGGFNISVAGTAFVYNTIPVIKDECVEIDARWTLKEAYCPRNTSAPRSLLVTCPAGTVCQNGINGGACVPQ